MQEINREVIEIKNKFLDEAKYSPGLLNDLAAMETYISESYQGRSLIELLQNADDCGSTKFYIKKLSTNLFLVANNGREFNNDDLISLCRSGSSTKKRKAGTIGFRGIGFKSVVNYAEEVYLYSGNYCLLFSRELTKADLKLDIKVPLIRIPHVDINRKYGNEFFKLKQDGYTTMFVFETRNETIVNEIDEFNNNCLLFLKNLNNIKFEFGKNKTVNIDRERNQIFRINDNNEISEWLVFKGTNNLNDVSIAFKMLNSKVIQLDSSVIHSFMPTAEKSNMPFIINGDFSTDPSRTKIIDDEETEKTIVSVVKLLTEIIKNILVSGYDEFGLINVISLYKKNNYDFLYPHSIQNKIFNEYILSLKNTLNSIVQLEKIKVQPNWIDEIDFKQFCDSKGYYSIYVKGSRAILGIENLLKQIENISFKVEEFLEFLKKYKATFNTRINTIITITNKYRYSFYDDIKELILNAYLFDYRNVLYRTFELLDKEIVNDSFYLNLESRVNDVNDLRSLLKKIGFKEFGKNKIDFKANSIYVNNILKNENNHINMEDKNKFHSKGLQHLLSNKTSDNTEAPVLKFNNKSNPKKWRSVEQNVKSVIENFDDVEYVTDVSKNNIGYDLIVKYLNGSEQYIEIKSVTSLGDAFSMTQNEYATANDNSFKQNYAVAIVEQNDEQMKMVIIDNKEFEKIKFIKRTVKFEWVSDSAYAGKYLTFNLEK